MKFNNIEIDWLGHDGFKINNSKIIYIDPFKIKENEKADLILITHEHFDHLSLEDLQKISTNNTIIVAAEICKGKFSELNFKELKFVKPGNKLKINNIEIEAVHSYNPNKQFHPKAGNRVGYILTINNTRIYHAGDTDLIPEMSNLKNIDAALLPISGTYVMNVNEAVEAVKIIKPKIAVPMHYGSIISSRKDAEEFKKQAEKYCKVEIV
jgi:L-ascorbate metabolism protein UlaG (beta-lactamase superfamily)